MSDNFDFIVSAGFWRSGSNMNRNSLRYPQSIQTTGLDKDAKGNNFLLFQTILKEQDGSEKDFYTADLWWEESTGEDISTKLDFFV